MPDFGLSFVNVHESALVARQSEQEFFLGAPNLLVGAHSPETWWISCTIVLTAPLIIIPVYATLSFAPGARFIVQAGASVVILGRLDAGLETRFVVVGHDLPTQPPSSPGVPATQVTQPPIALLGDLDEIRADWWAETAAGPSRVARALEVLWHRYRSGRLPAPIVLDGPYRLNAPLRVVPPSDLPGPIDVVLRGRHSNSGDPTTFVWDQPDSDMGAMMSVEGGAVLTLENVAFDDETPFRGKAGQVQCASCLAFEGIFDGSRVEACSFRHTHAAIQAYPLGADERNGVGGPLTAPGLTVVTVGVVTASSLVDAVSRYQSPPMRLDVGRCVFTATSTGDASDARGILIGFGAPTALSVSDSQFVGTFVNAISILGGSLDVVACQFASDSPSLDLSEPMVDIVTRSYDGQFFLGSDYRESTHVTITHCLSTSLSFLTLNQAFPSQGSIRPFAAGGAVLSNVRHVPSFGHSTLKSVTIGPGAPVRGVIFNGCALPLDVYIDAPPSTDVAVDFGSSTSSDPVSFYYRGGDAGPVTTM